MEIRDRLKIDIKFQHIKGHQDKEYAYSNFSRLAQLNVLTGDLAKEESKHNEKGCRLILVKYMPQCHNTEP